MSDTVNDHATRIAVLEEIARGTRDALERIERRLDTLERRMDDGFRSLAASQRSDFRWLLGIMLGGFAATVSGFAAMLGVMAHGFHWL